MGSHKLWAFAHAEYARVQVLDADLLPRANLDALFELAGAGDFVSCPGRLSTINAGWFAARPSCAHFAALSALLLRGGLAGGTAASRAAAAKAPGAAFDAARFWGHALEGWLNADRRPMPAGWGFFDGKGNQGQMYSYFRSATAGGRATPPPPPPPRPPRALSRG